MSDPKIPKAQKVTDEYGEIWWAYEANEIDEYLKSISTKPSHPLPAPTQLPPHVAAFNKWYDANRAGLYVDQSERMRMAVRDTARAAWFAALQIEPDATSGKEGE